MKLTLTWLSLTDGCWKPTWVMRLGVISLNFLRGVDAWERDTQGFPLLLYNPNPAHGIDHGIDLGHGHEANPNPDGRQRPVWVIVKIAILNPERQ